MNERDEYSKGDFVTRKVSLPPIRVDCSKWVDTTDGEWARGTFVVRKVSLPPIHVDCSKWAERGGVWLELRLPADDTASQQALAAARQLAPSLNLVADEARTRQEGGSLVVALRPTTPAADVEEQLARVVRDARSLAVGVTSAALCWAA